MADRAKYEKHKLDELRLLAKDRGIPTTGRKPDLIDRLVEHDEKQEGTPIRLVNPVQVEVAMPDLATSTQQIAQAIGPAVDRAVSELKPIVTNATDKLARVPGSISDAIDGAVDRAVDKAAGAFPALTSLERSLRPEEDDVRAADRVWGAIVRHTDAISFGKFDEFVSNIFQNGNGNGDPALADALTRAPFDRFVQGDDLYEVLLTASESFLISRAGRAVLDADSSWTNHPPLRPGSAPVLSGDAVVPGNQMVPRDVVERALRAFGGDRRARAEAILRSGSIDDTNALFSPSSLLWDDRFSEQQVLIELIWSYWMEEAMLTQTTSAITLRFQNVRSRDQDPLIELELSPLRALSGLLWGWIDTEPLRTSVNRRALEYGHHYGLRLFGRAVRQTPQVDPRSRFIEAFHNLLRQCDLFIKQDNDRTITPDGFPVLNSLKELRLILAEGMGNQFRDLPWKARVEMLVQQWMLSRPEITSFLRSRPMMPYPQPWMGTVDAMKRLQGWGEVTSIHFEELARFGEQLLLSVRYFPWNIVSNDVVARAWVRRFRPSIQSYIHAYHVVTGVSLIDSAVVESGSRTDGRYLQPGLLMRNRQLQARRRS